MIPELATIVVVGSRHRAQVAATVVKQPSSLWEDKNEVVYLFFLYAGTFISFVNKGFLLKSFKNYIIPSVNKNVLYTRQLNCLFLL